MRRPTLSVLALGLLFLACSHAAHAELFLNFDQPIYGTQVGQDVAVQVLLTQNATGIQVTPANTLLGTAVEIVYNTPGGIVSVQSIVGGPAWDLTSSAPGAGIASIANTSFAGIGAIPGGGLLLGTINFRGLALGSTTITLRTQTPGTSFPTSQGNFLDPTNTATARINVVPEPASLALAGTGLVLVVGGLAARSRRRRA